MDEWSPSHVSYLGLVPSRLGYCFRELWLDYSRQGRPILRVVLAQMNSLDLASYSSCSSLLDRAARCEASPALNSSSAFRLASTPKGEITVSSS